ncbi:hypothetical protein [Lacticaseibacillus paracasei]|uniref:hypothetical protein n=1 Tax=Lacticaseibacillus paracasei TaxID=1597 RepID=UPI003866DAE3
MSNETKRDVFDEVRYKFRNFKNEHRHGMYVSPDSVDHYLSDALKRYYAALPDDLPVIPQTVGEILRSAHGQANLLGVLDTAKNGYKVSETLAWIIANQNTFARAWVLGVWRVEETGEIVKLEEEK